MPIERDIPRGGHPYFPGRWIDAAAHIQPCAGEVQLTAQLHTNRAESYFEAAKLELSDARTLCSKLNQHVFGARRHVEGEAPAAHIEALDARSFEERCVRTADVNEIVPISAERRIDVDTRRPQLSGVVGGYSGMAVKPIAMRCVWEVAQALPDVPILGCGGITSGRDVAEYLLAGANAVALGTVHFAEPRAGRRIAAELSEYCDRHEVSDIRELIGEALPWT